MAADRTGKLGKAMERPEFRQAVAEIRASGLFDEDFYMLHHGVEVADSGLDPVTHYLLRGQALGYAPSRRFDSRFYLLDNPDIVPVEHDPLLHYLRRGREQGRPPLSPDRVGGAALPDLSRLRRPHPDRRLAVVLHLFYPAMWPEMAAHIAAIPEPCDLYVSLVQGWSEHMKAEVEAAFPGAAVLVFPNHGRDVLPFVMLFKTGVLDDYEFLCKLHTKRSPHRADGEAWRHNLLQSLVGDAGKVARLLEALRGDPSIGMVCADGNIGTAKEWLANRARVVNLARWLGIDPREDDITFPVGTMFWCRPRALALLHRLPVGAMDFEPERGALDGEFGHALERLFGVLCLESGLRVVEARHAAAKHEGNTNGNERQTTNT